MTKNRWIKAIGLGILLWVLMFVIVSVFIAYKIYDNLYVEILTAIIGGVIAFILAGFLKPEKMSSALLIGIIFAVTGLILDVVITIRFNAEIFKMWSLWLGYALVILAPLLQVRKVLEG